MKKTSSLLVLLLILSIKSYSQISFEKGYFISDSDKKTECLIKNLDSRKTPTAFEYKLVQDSVAQNASIENVKEFGIDGGAKYVRSTVKIDKSTDALKSLSSDRRPIFQTEQLFLNVLMEGNASLYMHQEGSLARFFYSLNDSEINQLVYKRYLVDSKIAENNDFRRQLFIDLKCNGITVQDIEGMRYTKRELVRLFTKFNECTNSDYVNYDSKQKQDLLNLSIRPGLHYNDLTIQNSSSDLQVIDFGSKFNFRFGVEAEYTLPFNKNKWAIFIEPTYQYFENDKTLNDVESVVGGILFSKVDYHSIAIPVGIRYYIFFNEKSKIFADFSVIYNVTTDSSIEFTRSDGSVQTLLDLESVGNIGFGMGYKYDDKYSLSVRYQTENEILSGYTLWDSTYKTFSIIFGYTLF